MLKGFMCLSGRCIQRLGPVEGDHARGCGSQDVDDPGAFGQEQGGLAEDGGAGVDLEDYVVGEQGLTVAVRGGGHSLPGFSTCDGGIVIDLSAMRAVEVDPDRRVAIAQGGARWGDYDGITHSYGLASTGGIVSTTGVASTTRARPRAARGSPERASE
ncbi:MAG: FAD-binding protein [Pseudonocardiaceae bacterium]